MSLAITLFVYSLAFISSMSIIKNNDTLKQLNNKFYIVENTILGFSLWYGIWLILISLCGIALGIMNKNMCSTFMQIAYILGNLGFQALYIFMMMCILYSY